MAEFNVQLTKDGAELLAKAISGQEMRFTHIVMGESDYSGNIYNIKDVISPRKSLSIVRMALGEGQATVRAILRFKEVLEGFHWREIGLYAKDMLTETEVLYAYGNARDKGDYIPSGDSSTLDEKNINITAIVSNAEAVTAVIDESLLFVTQQDLDNKVDKVDGKQLSSNDYTTAEKTKLSEVEVEANNYTLTAATAAALGGIKSGGDITINSSGMVAINDDSHNHVIANVDGLQTAMDSKAGIAVATTTANGLMASADKVKLSGIETGANNYVHPTGHPASMIVQDATKRFVTDTEKAAWNGKAGTSVANTTANGLMASTDKVKLDGVAVGANNYVHPTGHPASMIVQDANNRFMTDAEKATWNGKAGTSVATTTANGLMASADKVKLDGVAVGANNYVHPTNHPASVITQDANNRFMTDAERTKLTGIATGANNYVHPTSHPASVITQDATKRFVTDAEKTTWNGKANKLDTTILFTHAKTGTIHTLTGTAPTSGFYTARFKAVADFVDGDTFKVNNVVYAAQDVLGEEITGFKIGAVVSVEVDVAGKKVNFKSGGGNQLDNYNLFTSLTPPSTFGGVWLKDTSEIKNIDIRLNVTFEGIFSTISSIPSATTSFGCTSDGANIYCIGGGGTVSSQSTNRRFNITENSWTTRANRAVAAFGHPAIIKNSKIYVFGGAVGNSLYNRTDIYDIATNTWSQGANMLQARYNFSAVEYGNKIYIFGGKDTVNTFYKVTDIYDISKNTWSQGASIPYTTDGTSNTTLSNGKAYIVNTNRIQIYDISKNTWVQGKNCKYKNTFRVVTTYKDKIYSFGGAEWINNLPQLSKGCEVYNISKNEWGICEDLPIPIYQAGGVIVNDVIYQIAGNNTVTGITNQCYKFKITDQKIANNCLVITTDKATKQTQINTEKSKIKQQLSVNQVYTFINELFQAPPFAVGNGTAWETIRE